MLTLLRSPVATFSAWLATFSIDVQFAIQNRHFPTTSLTHRGIRHHRGSDKPEHGRQHDKHQVITPRTRQRSGNEGSLPSQLYAPPGLYEYAYRYVRRSALVQRLHRRDLFIRRPGTNRHMPLIFPSRTIGTALARTQ